MRRQMRSIVQKTLLGFASGVMVAASVWSLLIPAMEMSADMESWLSFRQPAVLSAVSRFCWRWTGLSRICHLGSNEAEGHRSRLRKTTMMTLAVTLHNIPEGMAVGAVYAALLASGSEVTMASAFALSLGIAIQNFPEGAIVSMPLRAEKGMNRLRAFLYGVLSGAVEPLAACLMILLSASLEPLLPLFLSFAAGAMLYVVVEELIP